MIRRVLGVPAEAVAIDTLEGLVDSNRVEDQALELKRELPGNSDSDKTSFRTDVAAVANGGGGVVIYGVDEGPDGTATAIVPFQLAGQAERLQQLINTRIEPHLPVQIVEVPEEGADGEGCLVLDVPGLSRPYAVRVNNRWAYPRRTGRTIDHMSESQIAQMYRARLRRQNDVRERLEELHTLCLRSEVSPLLPQLSVLGTPSEPAARLFRPDGATKHRIRSIPTTNVFTPSEMGAPIFSQSRSGFRRIDLAPDFQTTVRDRYGWAGFHDDGSCHRVVRGSVVESNVEEMNGKPGFYDTWLTVSVCATLHGYGLLLEEFGVDSEIILQVRLADMALPAPLVPSGVGVHSYEATVATHPFVTEISAEANELASPKGALATAKPLLDDVFSAFTWEGCPFFSDDGALAPERWPSRWQAGVKNWARIVGLDV